MYIYIYIYIYIYLSICHLCIQKVPHHHIQHGLTGLYKHKNTYIEALMAPLEHHHPVLSQEEVPHQLGVPRVLGAAFQSLFPLLPLLYGSTSATLPVGPHTTSELPCPRCTSTCPQALPAIPPLVGGENPQTPPRPPPEEHVMALHPSPHRNVSWSLSHHQQASPQHHLIVVSLLPMTLPMEVSLAPNEPTL